MYELAQRRVAGDSGHPGSSSPDSILPSAPVVSQRRSHHPVMDCDPFQRTVVTSSAAAQGRADVQMFRGPSQRPRVLPLRVLALSL